MSNPRTTPDEDGLLAPSVDAVRTLMRILGTLTEWRLCGDGEGGVNLERRYERITVRFEIASDGTVERLEFCDGHLVSRSPVTL